MDDHKHIGGYNAVHTIRIRVEGRPSDTDVKARVISSGTSVSEQPITYLVRAEVTAFEARVTLQKTAAW